MLPVKALHRLWDVLFVLGPAATMQSALACMHLIEPSVLAARDIGDALTSIKEALRAAIDGEQLVELTLYRVAHFSIEQLRAWRQHCRQLAINYARSGRSQAAFDELVGTLLVHEP